MTDSAIGIDRSIDAPAYSPLVSADRGGTRSIRSLSADSPESAPNDLATLVRLGISKVETGADAEATECFRKALELGDRTLGPDNPDRILLLNDLTRLYLKQSAYAEAEPLLLRLLDMKRSKGEDHPEVATVLASLATVRQALGRHESAEHLWRRVLEIRERTLAPNHFAIATALEHLGDACAARGNISEALPAFQRALTIREKTLGSGHPSLRTSKERIADLQLQAAEDTLDAGVGSGMMPTPERYRLLSSEHLRLSSPTPVREELPAPTPKDVSPAATSRQTRVVLQIPTSDALTVTDPPVRDAVVDVTAAAASEALPYRDALESIREELEQPYPATSLPEKFAVWVEMLTAFLTRRQVVAVMIVVVISLLLLAVGKDRAWGDFDQNAAPNTASAQQLPAAAPSTSLSALSTPVREVANVPASSAQAKTSPAKPKVEEHSTARKAEESKSDTKKISLPTLSKSIFSQLDSVASKTAAASARPDQVLMQPAPTVGGNRRSSFDSGDQSVGPLRARLIGNLPTPRVPRQAIDIEGQVLVRFTVDVQGRPMMETFSVEDSPSEYLTAAVRYVIPTMRFEPAHVAGPDSKAIADVVQIGFRFTKQR